jgi:hypothetical protein
MATPRSSTYAVPSGGSVLQGIAAAYPAWRAGMAIGEVKAIPGTAFTLGDEDRINAWGAFVLIDGTATLVSPANGGHHDTYENAVDTIDLSADAPAWVNRIPSSSFASVTNNSSYNADGKPGTRHGYGYAHYISQRNRVMLFGQRSQWPDGGDGYTIDGIDVSGDTWTWDPAGTYPNITPGHFGLVRDPVSGNVWLSVGHRWNQAANTVTNPGTFTGFNYFPACYDSSRLQCFGIMVGDGQGNGETFSCKRWDASTGSQTTLTINASAAYTQFLADSPEYMGLDYDAANDRYLAYDGRGGLAGRIYVITPNLGAAYDMSLLSTTGVTPAASAIGGINSRWKYIPSLGGFAFMPTAASGMYFLATS